MTVFDQVLSYLGLKNPAPQLRTSGESPARSSEIGLRTTPEEEIALLYRQLEPSYLFRNKILEIRDMDEKDGRVKKIHERTARKACQGGLFLKVAPTSKVIQRLWLDFERRLQLNHRGKLESDMRGALMEGNVPMQWVLDLDQKHVFAGLRMPTETIKPLVDITGQFFDPARAYEQWDYVAGKVAAVFPLWQLNMVRIRPDNFDNYASFGRPYLDATRATWRQLAMTERDLVVRRHTRAPQRFSHVLEGASQPELDAYEQKIKNKLGLVTTDFTSNKKGGVTALQGDTNLEHIADVVYLLDTFFSGSPAPKGVFGYAEGLNRDIMADLMADYYDELDALQDNVSFIYEMGFRLELLLNGINPDAEEICVEFFERRTETPNQRADLALKHQAMGVPAPLNWRTAGLDPVEVQEYVDQAKAEDDPYPLPNSIAIPAAQPRVSITPGNSGKGESATSLGK